MDEILSQEEVNALLKGISEGKVETEKGVPAGDAQVYEFPRVEEGEEGDALPRMEKVAAKVASAVNESLIGLLKRPVEVGSVEVRYESGEECFSRLPDLCSLSLFSMDPLKGSGLLILDAGMIFSLMDLLFGGRGTAKVERKTKEFTPIEMKVVQKLACTILEDLEGVWKELFPVKVRLLRSESDPSDVPFASPGEKVVTVEAVHAVGDLHYRYQVCFPLKLFDPVREKLGGVSASGGAEGEWREKIRELVMTIPVEVTCLLGRSTVTVLEGLRMKEGDILPLDTSPQGNLSLLASGVEKFEGFLGSFQGRYAVKIVRAITP
ncbi:MAG: hypothetical protein D6713_02345 [Deltaproteobacteria bacterium]|nr:MAG: hypothetical protein D6713_02345 [Deltaproteobacteria bacterium]